MLDTKKGNNRTALSYAFRPLTKNKYISKHKDGSVNILAKGRVLFANVSQLVASGSGEAGIKRVNSISRIAALFSRIGIESVSSPDITKNECFVPSACWRKIRTGILSTVKFTGILFLREERLVVYDIGDGSVEWQLRAERSLFYNDYFDKIETHATGMLLVCDNDKRIKTAIKIIRETMWRRKQLIEYESYYQRERPVKYAHSPIRLTHHYEKAYLTTPSLLEENLAQIRNENDFIDKVRKNIPLCENRKQGDFIFSRYQFFVNPATDLLKYVYFFSEAKSDLYYGKKELKYIIFSPEKDLPILQMYSDIYNAEGVEIYEC